MIAGPSNTAVVMHESNATLSCTINSTIQLLNWLRGATTLVSNNYSLNAGYFSAILVNGRSILTINTEVANVPTVGSVAGPYTCNDPSGTVQPVTLSAQLILLGTNYYHSLLDKFNGSF